MRLTSSNSGRTALPPSHPQAATIDASPPAAPNRRKSRRLTPTSRSVMAREPPPIPTRDHRAQRRRIRDKDEHHMDDEEGDKDPHSPEVPVAGGLKAAKKRCDALQLGPLFHRQFRT